MMTKEKLFKLSEKIKRMNKTNYLNFIPRQTLSVNINEKEYYISIICDDNFQVQVVLLNKNNQIIDRILEIDGDRAYITKLQNNLYIFTDRKVYIYNINNLKNASSVLFTDNLDIQCICSNENNLYAYSISKDKIIKYDKKLTPVQEYDNKYSKNNLRVSIYLTCNQETFFSIPIMSPTEEQYVSMKKFMEHNVGLEIANVNDKITSCSYNNNENTLYISMYNVIWIIKDGTDFRYLYFKDKAITSALYDNSINKLIVNFGDTKNNHLIGSIIKLTNEEIERNSLPLYNISKTYSESKNLINESNGRKR